MAELPLVPNLSRSPPAIPANGSEVQTTQPKAKETKDTSAAKNENQEQQRLNGKETLKKVDKKNRRFASKPDKSTKPLTAKSKSYIPGKTFTKASTEAEKEQQLQQQQQASKGTKADEVQPVKQEIKDSKQPENIASTGEQGTQVVSYVPPQETKTPVGKLSAEEKLQYEREAMTIFKESSQLALTSEDIFSFLDFAKGEGVAYSEGTSGNETENTKANILNGIFEKSKDLVKRDLTVTGKLMKEEKEESVSMTGRLFELDKEHYLILEAKYFYRLGFGKGRIPVGALVYVHTTFKYTIETMLENISARELATSNVGYEMTPEDLRNVEEFYGENENFSEYDQTGNTDSYENGRSLSEFRLGASATETDFSGFRGRNPDFRGGYHREYRRPGFQYGRRGGYRGDYHASRVGLEEPVAYIPQLQAAKPIFQQGNPETNNDTNNNNSNSNNNNNSGNQGGRTNAQTLFETNGQDLKYTEAEDRQRNPIPRNDQYRNREPNRDLVQRIETGLQAARFTDGARGSRGGTRGRGNLRGRGGKGNLRGGLMKRENNQNSIAMANRLAEYIQKPAVTELRALQEGEEDTPDEFFSRLLERSKKTGAESKVRLEYIATRKAERGSELKLVEYKTDFVENFDGFLEGMQVDDDWVISLFDSYPYLNLKNPETWLTKQMEKNMEIIKRNGGNMGLKKKLDQRMRRFKKAVTFLMLFYKYRVISPKSRRWDFFLSTDYADEYNKFLDLNFNLANPTDNNEELSSMFYFSMRSIDGILEKITERNTNLHIARNIIHQHLTGGQITITNNGTILDKDNVLNISYGGSREVNELFEDFKNTEGNNSKNRLTYADQNFDIKGVVLATAYHVDLSVLGEAKVFDPYIRAPPNLRKETKDVRDAFIRVREFIIKDLFEWDNTFKYVTSSNAYLRRKTEVDKKNQIANTKRLNGVDAPLTQAPNFAEFRNLAQPKFTGGNMQKENLLELLSRCRVAHEVIRRFCKSMRVCVSGKQRDNRVLPSVNPTR